MIQLRSRETFTYDGIFKKYNSKQRTQRRNFDYFKRHVGNEERFTKTAQMINLRVTDKIIIIRRNEL